MSLVYMKFITIYFVQPKYESTKHFVAVPFIALLFQTV